LTKRLAEDLTTFLQEQNVRCRWLHSELDAFERVDLLQELREGAFDALVGVNLLREGLDLPEVSLVAILDADKEGFLRSETSLIQTIGRAARNVNARVILYADKMTQSMRAAIDETERRRKIQEEYNRQHGITPTSVRKAIRAGIESDGARRREASQAAKGNDGAYVTLEFIETLEREMMSAAEDLEFERAGKLRDRIVRLKKAIGRPLAEVEDGRDDEPRGGRGRKGSGKTRVPRPKRP
jgi:excinuclease ABC subunit B